MAGNVIKLKLNQQQLELLDRTVARGVAADRAALVRLAVREYAAARQAETQAKPNDREPLR
jgi:Arc/MetJ-type ribon-helix-helix transcriptional regulator